MREAAERFSPASAARSRTLLVVLGPDDTLAQQRLAKLEAAKR